MGGRQRIWLYFCYPSDRPKSFRLPGKHAKASVPSDISHMVREIRIQRQRNGCQKVSGEWDRSCPCMTTVLLSIIVLAKFGNDDDNVKPSCVRFFCNRLVKGMVVCLDWFNTHWRVLPPTYGLRGRRSRTVF